MPRTNGHQPHDPRTDQPRPPFPPQTQESPGSEAAMDPKPDYGEHTYRGYGRLEGRVAIVTGGDSGIGRAVAVAFAREGADVTIAYLDEHQDARESRRVVESAGRRALLMPGDLGDDAHCAKVVRDTLDGFGRLDILVNNAAYQGKLVERFEDLDAARIERTFRTNIVSMFNLTRHALPHLPAGGSIINTSSIQAYHPNPGIIDYASTKGAIRVFTEGLSKELVPRGIRVNAVAPGPVWTPLVVASFNEKKNAQHGKSAPIQRPAQPVEIAPVFVFLACDEARYVSGEILAATGGSPTM